MAPQSNGKHLNLSVQFTTYQIWILILPKIFQIDINRWLESAPNKYYSIRPGPGPGIHPLPASIQAEKKSAWLYFFGILPGNHDHSDPNKIDEQAMADEYHEAFLFFFMLRPPACDAVRFRALFLAFLVSF